MKRIPSLATATALLLAAAGSAHAADRCNWQATARGIDEARAGVEPQALAHLLTGNDKRDANGLATARDLLKRAEKPLPLGKVTGQWRVNSVQVNRDFAWVYPAFRATISDPPGCGMRFAKTTGSQRRSGGLYPMANGVEWAFLGGKTVNNDPQVAYDSRKDANSNTAGRLLRISKTELLMILDAADDSVELYLLRR